MCNDPDTENMFKFVLTFVIDLPETRFVMFSMIKKLLTYAKRIPRNVRAHKGIREVKI